MTATHESDKHALDPGSPFQSQEEDMSGARPTLVTGAGGCVGAWVVRQLVEEGSAVVASDVTRDTSRLALLLDDEQLDGLEWATFDVTDLTAVAAAIDHFSIGSVIHLAGLQAPFCRENPVLGAQVNVVGTVNLMQAVADRADRVGPFVYASSVAAADRADGLAPETIYGVYKRACEGAADVYLRERELPSIGLRPHTVYGPGRDRGLTSAPTFAMQAAAAGSSYEIPFTGRLTMQYAPDVAAAFVASSRASSYVGSGVFDLPGDTVDVTDLICAIEAVAPAASIVTSGGPLPFPPDVAPRPDAPFADSAQVTPLAEGVADAVRRFGDLQARGLAAPPSRPRG